MSFLIGFQVGYWGVLKPIYRESGKTMGNTGNVHVRKSMIVLLKCANCFNTCAEQYRDFSTRVQSEGVEFINTLYTSDFNCRAK